MISYAALSPHPPLIIPEIGREDIKQVASTTEAMETMAAELLASRPDTIVFLTPHGNVFSDCVSMLTEPQLQGNFSNFRQPDISLHYENDLDFVQQLLKNSRENNLYLLGINRETASKYNLNPELDHGILVPLYYLRQAGFASRIVAISIGMLSNIDLYKFGCLIQQTADQLGCRVAVVASGDMSHRLKEDGPYHFHPDGSVFDQKIKEIISTNNMKGLLSISENLRENAGECGFPSIVIMLGALDGYEVKSRIFSYEGPFGVGYLVAGLQIQGQRASILEYLLNQSADKIRKRRENESVPVKLARLTLESRLKNEASPAVQDDMRELLHKKAGAFVSIKKNGQLRGCIGTFLPAYANLAEEIKHNALSAGLNDPRFMPVEREELDSLVYSVDILSEPEPCTRQDLDPEKYGVIVSRGAKRGLLLPALEGVDTVEKQLEIALQKAGLSPREQFAIQRFEVQRYH